MRTLLASAAVIALAAPAFAQDDAVADAPAIEAPAGTYGLDATHASVTWRVLHLGLARYTGRFTDFDATLQWDPENLENISVSATINPASIETDYDDISPERRRDVDFDQELRDEAFRVGEFPEATFQSTSVTLAEDEHEGGLAHAVVEGDLTLLGVTAPVSLHVTLNGALAEHPFAGVGALGFSAEGSFDRTAFGLDNWQGSVASDVTIEIEAEFIQRPE